MGILTRSWDITWKDHPTPDESHIFSAQWMRINPLNLMKSSVSTVEISFFGCEITIFNGLNHHFQWVESAFLDR